MLSDRSLFIVKYCISKNEYVTTEELGEALNVSSRTIKSDLIEIEKHTSKLGISLDLVRGLGVKIKIVDVNKFNEKINLKTNFKDFSIQSNRLIYIIQKFIHKSSYVSEDELLNELYVSRTLLLEDIEIVKDLFLEENVSITRTRKKGWKAEGPEEQLRKLLARYIELDINFLDAYNLYLSNNNLTFEEISILKTLVIDILHKHNKQAFGVNITNLIVHILILVNRIKTGNSLSYSHIDCEVMIEKDELQLVEDLVSTIESIYKLKISEAETYYLYCCMLGKYSELDELSDRMIINFLHSTFINIEEIFGIEIQDDTFFNAIYAHTQSLLNRLRLNIKLEPTIDIIINEFVLPNECALIYKNKFYEYFQLEIDDVELYYITIHFGAYLEKIRRVKSKKSILLVSDERFSISMYIKSKINSGIGSEAEIEAILQSHELSKIDISKYDHIISTEDIGDVCEDFLLIDKAATMLTVRQVQEYVKDNKTIFNYFKKDLFFTDVKVKDMKILLNEMAEKFESKGYIENSSEFVNEVIKREDYQSTRLNHGIAIPHPLKPMSNNSFISTIIPEKPIVWSNGKEAKLIFIISLAPAKLDNEVNIIFDILSKIASSQHLINQLVKETSYESFMKMVLDYQAKER